jgi:hypothetical protein
MSSISTRTITCARCQRPDQFRFYDSINVTLSPELREQVFGRTLFRFRCPGCGLAQVIAYRFLYHDMTHRLMCWMVWERPGMPIAVAPDMDLGMQGLGEGYRLRVVGSIESLIETAVMTEAGLDDLVMQVLKAFIWKSHDTRALRAMYFSHIKDGQLAFAMVGTAGRLIWTPMKSYEVVRADLESRGAAARLGTGYQIVDMALGARLLPS